MKASAPTIGATLASALALTIPAYAQDAGTEAQQTAQSSQCIESLNALAQRMNDDGYWLTGYRGYGTGTLGAPYPSRGPTGNAAPTVTTPGVANAPVVQPAEPAVPDAEGASPWTNVTWEQRPQYEIATLYRAANVLAANGNEDACMTVANATEERYDGYVSQLSDLGVDPQEITSWRQAEIAAAVPVAESSFPRRIDDLLGADVRNAQDEDLGDIEDVVLNPGSGGVQYVVVSRGGFFGIGSESVPVPWERLHVVPSTSTFVLPVDEAAMDAAPRVARENLVDPAQTGSTEQSEVESYWEQATGQ